jgi:hypothetical protein
VNALMDVARFGADERPEIVTSSFLCPVCVHVDCAGRIAGSSDDTVVECTCRRCATEWTLAVDGWQALRLILSPPPRDGEGWHLELEPTRQAPA